MNPYVRERCGSSAESGDSHDSRAPARRRDTFHDALRLDLKADYNRVTSPFKVSYPGSEKLREDVELARGGPTMAPKSAAAAPESTAAAPESTAAPPDPPERENKDWDELRRTAVEAWNLGRKTMKPKPKRPVPRPRTATRRAW
jgi:pyruvate/2-oxoglutarate dehydrogenase complex dihydrolipoamide acyltransferase (E2) component